MTTFRALAVAAAVFLTTMLAGCAGDAPPGVTIEMGEAGVASAVAQNLPETLVFSDRMGTAAVAFVPTPVDVDDHATLERYRAGDVVYWRSEQSLVVFLSDGTADPDDGLVLVGTATDGIENLSSCSPDCSIRVTARHVEDGEHRR